jgi:hypothetical protein
MAVEDNGNPFNAPLASEVQDHQQAQAVTVATSNNGNPFDEPLMSEKAEAAAQAQAATKPTIVPNARIRNLPNPAEGLTPSQALINGAQTGAELAAVPATAIGLGEVAPVITHLAENLPNLDKAWKIVKIVGGGTYTLQHLKDVLKVLGGGSNNK